MKHTIKMMVVSLAILILVGCNVNVTQKEYYNEKDKADFTDKDSFVIKFKPVNFENVLDKDTVTRSQLHGGFFVLSGYVTGSSETSSEIVNYYYGYVENTRGGTYFAKIPADKVRIYQDATEGPYLIGFHGNWQGRSGSMDPNEESQWSKYEMFNLHVKKGTIIPKADVKIATELGIVKSK